MVTVVIVEVVMIMMHHRHHSSGNACHVMACIDIYSSSFAAAAYLEQHPLPAGKKVYVVGMEGICEELALLNIPYIGGPCGNDPTTTTGGGGGRVITLGGSSLRRIDQDPDVAAVVVGMDPAINYYKIQYAQLCIHKNKDCVFIATNLDMVFPTEEDQDWAAGGAMVSGWVEL